MKQDIFGEMLQQFDKIMSDTNRKVILLVDNASSHKSIKIEVTNTIVYYFLLI